MTVIAFSALLSSIEWSLAFTYALTAWNCPVLQTLIWFDGSTIASQLLLI